MIVPVVQSTSATDGLEGESFAVFPIPVDDCLVLKNAPIGSRARIVDTTGKAITDTIVNEPEESIPTQYLTSGVYFLQIESDSSPVTRKFIVQH